MESITIPSKKNVTYTILGILNNLMHEMYFNFLEFQIKLITKARLYLNSTKTGCQVAFEPSVNDISKPELNPCGCFLMSKSKPLIFLPGAINKLAPALQIFHEQ